jgi:hypothetical protein
MTHDHKPPTHPPATGDAPGNDGPPISPLVPGSMHRAEQDREAFATSPEFHERPAHGAHTAPAASKEPASVRDEPAPAGDPGDHR